MRGAEVILVKFGLRSQDIAIFRYPSFWRAALYFGRQAIGRQIIWRPSYYDPDVRRLYKYN